MVSYAWSMTSNILLYFSQHCFSWLIGNCMSFWIFQFTWIPWNLSFRFISFHEKTNSKWCCDTTTQESIHTEDESKRDSAFAFIFGVNWPVQWMWFNDKFMIFGMLFIVTMHEQAVYCSRMREIIILHQFHPIRHAQITVMKLRACMTQNEGSGYTIAAATSWNLKLFVNCSFPKMTIQVPSGSCPPWYVTSLSNTLPQGVIIYLVLVTFICFSE